MHDWMVKRFMPRMEDPYDGPFVKRYYDIVKKFDVSENECKFIRHCSNYMNSDSLSPGIMSMYGCTIDESYEIIAAVNW